MGANLRRREEVWVGISCESSSGALSGLQPTPSCRPQILHTTPPLLLSRLSEQFVHVAICSPMIGLLRCFTGPCQAATPPMPSPVSRSWHMHANRNVCIHVDPERLLLFSKLHRHPSLHIMVSALRVARGASGNLSRKALRNCTVIQPGIRSDSFFESPAGGAAARCWWVVDGKKAEEENKHAQQEERSTPTPRAPPQQVLVEAGRDDHDQRTATACDPPAGRPNTCTCEYTVHRTAGADNIEIASECRG
jgi:hypothetical protein